MEGIYQLGFVLSLIDKISSPAQQILNTVQRIRDSVGGASQAMRDWGQKSMIAGGALTLMAAQGQQLISGFIHPLVEVTDAMAPLEVVTTSTMGSIQKSLEASKQAALEWSQVHTQTAAQFLAANTTMGSAGLNDVQALAGTQQALGLATATMGDHIEAANLLATVYNNFGDKTKNAQVEMQRFADIMAQSQALFQYKDLNVLSESLKYANGTAIASRHGFEELNVVLGQLNNAGLQGSTAGEAYTSFMQQLLPASSQLGFAIARNTDGSFNFIATLEQITAKYGDISRASPQVQMAFLKAFGAQGIRPVQLLQSKVMDMKNALMSVGEATGAVQKMQQVMENAPTAQWGILVNNVNALKMAIAESLLPSLTAMIPPIQNVVSWLSNFAQAHPGVTQIIGQFMLWGTVLFGLVGTISLVAGAVMFMGSTLIQAGTGVATLSSKLWGLLTALYQNTIASARLGMIGLRMLAQSAANLAIRFWALLPSIWATTVALLANPMTWVVVGIVALIGALVWLGMNFDTVAAIAANTWNTITTWFMNGWNWVMGILNQAITFLQQWGPTFLAIFAPIIGVPMLIAQNWDQIVAYLSGLWQTFKNSGAGLIDAFVQGIQSVIHRPYEVMEQALTNLRQLLPFSDAKEGPLSELTRSGRAVPGTIAEGIIQAGRVLPQALHQAMQPMLQGISPVSVPIVPAFAGETSWDSISEPSPTRSSSMFANFFSPEGISQAGTNGNSISQSSTSTETKHSTYNFNLYQHGSSDHSLLMGIRRYLEAHEE